MYQFLLHVPYWFAFSCCSTMELTKLGICLPRLSPFGSYLLAELVYTISFTGTTTSSVGYPQYTCTSLLGMSTLAVGGH